MNDVYAFVYRGMLSEEALDKIGRYRRKHFTPEDARELQKSLCYDLMEPDCLADAQHMSTVYTAIHSFENMIRRLVAKAMAEHHGANWWHKVPDRIQKKVATRMEEEAKFRWHGARGNSEVNYCDFGDLSSIIVTSWDTFEDVLGNLEWAKTVLSTLEKSRNIAMHAGLLAREDIERIGMNIRDWVRQTG